MSMRVYTCSDCGEKSYFGEEEGNLRCLTPECIEKHKDDPYRRKIMLTLLRSGMYDAREIEHVWVLVDRIIASEHGRKDAK